MSEKLLSVVIPTKDREYYCKRVLDYMLTIDDDRIEFVVQNNGSSDELDEYVKEKNDSRIVYRHIYEPLCQVDNSDQSIALSTGQYICFIGDDDIVLPNIMQYVEYAINNNIDSIAQKTPISYYWPSKTWPTGRFNYHDGDNQSKMVISNHNECINKYISNGCCKNPKDFRLPVLYHGITRRQCIENVKNETGHYVGGSSPDSYTSVSLAKYVNNQIIIADNFSIFGACPQSATALNIVGGHCGTLDDAPHLKNRGLYEWDCLIPRYYSVQTIWAESAVKALRETHNRSVDKINLRELFCEAYLKNKSIRKLIIRETIISLERNGNNLLLFWVIVSFKIMCKKIHMIYALNKARVQRLLNKTDKKAILNVKDISDCIQYMH